MSAAEDAYEAAREEIARVKAAGETTLDFGKEAFYALDRLPPEIAEVDGLEKLGLEGTQIRDLSPLQELKGLRWLDLDQTPVSDIAPLQGMRGLQLLWLNETQVSDIAVLHGLSELQVLYLNRTQISDVTPLQGLGALRKLSLAQTQVSDIAPLQGLSELKELTLSFTPVSDITPLQGLSALRTLHLDHTQVSDLRPVLTLPALRNSAEDTELGSALSFLGSAATELDPKLRALSEIEDVHERTLKTLAHLATLPEGPARVSSQTINALAERVARVSSELVEADQSVKVVSNNISELKDIAGQSQIDFNSLTEALEAARSRLDAFEKETEQKIANVEKEYQESMDAAERAFREEQAIKEPVELWKEKQNEHETNRDKAFFRFGGGLMFVVLAVLSLLWFMNTQTGTVEALLAPVGCNLEVPESCKGFSLRGLISTASVLTLLTILLWFTRLQMKLFLAERHLALDARERRAFAQAYTGLLKEGDTSEEAQQQRALVYTALFRPSTDGTVKEDGGLDPAVTAAISKILSR